MPRLQNPIVRNPNPAPKRRRWLAFAGGLVAGVALTALVVNQYFLPKARVTAYHQLNEPKGPSWGWIGNVTDWLGGLFGGTLGFVLSFLVFVFAVALIAKKFEPRQKDRKMDLIGAAILTALVVVLAWGHIVATVGNWVWFFIALGVIAFAVMYFRKSKKSKTYTQPVANDPSVTATSVSS